MTGTIDRMHAPLVRAIQIGLFSYHLYSLLEGWSVAESPLRIL